MQEVLNKLGDVVGHSMLSDIIVLLDILTYIFISLSNPDFF